MTSYSNLHKPNCTDKHKPTFDGENVNSSQHVIPHDWLDAWVVTMEILEHNFDMLEEHVMLGHVKFLHILLAALTYPNMVHLHTAPQDYHERTCPSRIGTSLMI